MRHFHRTHLVPADVIVAADEFFPKLELATKETAARGRVFSGPLGTLKLSVKPEGGHYTFVEVETDQDDETSHDGGGHAPSLVHGLLPGAFRSRSSCGASPGAAGRAAGGRGRARRARSRAGARR